EGFFKIYLISGSDKLEFIVDNTEYVFDVQKDYRLRYNAALDIFRYFGSKYLQELMENSSSHK
ncbi:MAG: hypothetical protein K6E69_05300, partial [Treponema sp.]|uniref:hypothetical protein n=1 Tax=Treponema sp. TaxID=166 RepID=UPI00298D93AC